MTEFTPQIEKVLAKCRKLNEENDNQFWIIDDEVGRFLNQKAKEINAKKILEIGASIGYSTIFWGEAVRVNGQGRLKPFLDEKAYKVYAMESHKERSEIAKEHVAEAGLGDSITIIKDHAPENIPFKDPDTGESLEGKIDILFLDCIKMYYQRCFEKVFPGQEGQASGLPCLLHPGSLIIADNVNSHPEPMQDFLDTMKSDPRVESEILDMGTGLLVAKIKKTF